MPEIFDATVDLFAFYLGNKSADNQKAIAPNYDHFWEDLAQKLNQPVAPNLKFRKKIDTHTIHGFYERQTIDDTESFWLNGSIYLTQDFVATLPDFKKLAPVNIPPDNFLGQTWLITGWLEQEIAPNLKSSLVEKAYKAITDKDAQYQQESKFLGATVFELWRATDCWDGIEQDSHLIIILYDCQTSEENKNNFKIASSYYHAWRYLMYCRHKIIWAYQQAMELRQELLLDYSQSAPNVADLSQKDLKELQKELQDNIDTLSRYVTNLNYLETQKHTLEVNLRNYKRKYNDAFKVVDCLAEFIRIATDKYKFQMEEDHASLRPGLSIRENLTATIRGMVEIEQAKSDRIFQVTIGILGVGIGTASITASAISPFIETITGHPLKKIENSKDIPIPENARFNFLATLGISGTVGLFFILISWGIIEIIKRWHRRSKARKTNAKSKN